MTKQHNRISKETQEERIKEFKKTLEFPLSREEITDTPKTQALVQSWRALDYRRRISDPEEAAEFAEAQGLIAGHRDHLLVLDWLYKNGRLFGCYCHEVLDDDLPCMHCHTMQECTCSDLYLSGQGGSPCNPCHKDELKQDAEIYF